MVIERERERERECKRMKGRERNNKILFAM